MIQRVQTIYLLLAAVFSALSLFLPQIGFTDAKSIEVATATGLGITSTLSELAGRHPAAPLSATTLATVVPLIAIFLFKKRKRQMSFCTFAVELNVLAIILYAINAYNICEATALSPTPKVGIICPILAIVAALMARRGIKRDDDMVRSEYRIR